MKLFISYARADEAFAREVRSALEAWGHSTWMDVANIPPGSAWADEIQKGLEWADGIVGVMTKDALASDSAKDEWDWTLVNQTKLKKALYLLRTDDSSVPMRYIRVNWIDLYGKGRTAALEQLRSWLDAPIRNIAANVGNTPEIQAYLQALYDEIMQELNSQVLSPDRVINLVGSEAPEYVPEVRRRETRRMLRAFSITRNLMGEAAPIHSFEAAYDLFLGRLLLLGPPGAGKTVTLLIKARDAVIERLQDVTKPLPFIGRIATWNARSQTPLADWLAEYTSLSVHEVKRSYEAGTALLLLDGLDELGTTRTDTITNASGKEVEDTYDPRPRFLRQLPDSNAIVLTCRIRDYEEIGHQANLNGAVTVHALSDGQIETYLRDTPNTADLWEQLRAQPALLDLARNPLLLGAFAFAYRDAPETVRALRNLDESELRDAIFSQFVERSYWHEAQRYLLSGQEPPFALDQIRSVLGRVAMRNAGPERRRYWTNHDDDEAITDNVLIRDDVERALPDSERNELVDRFIDYCVEARLIVRGRANRIHFVHLLLRDYLVFDYCAPQLGNVEAYVDPTGYGFFYSPTTHASALARTDRRALNLLTELIAKTAQQRSWEEGNLRKCAIIAISEIHGEEAVQTLIDLLRREPDNWAAGYAIGRTKNPRIKDILVEAAGKGNPWAMVSLLEMGGDPQVVEVIIPWLRAKTEYARDEKTRWTAEQLLYESVRTPDHVPFLMGLLQDEHPFVRASAAQALGKLKCREAIPLLSKMLEDGVNVHEDLGIDGPAVREFAKKALSKMEDPDA